MIESGENLVREAEALHRQGRRTEAIEGLRGVLGERPQLTEVWYELGYLLKAAGNYPEALSAYAEALARGVSRAAEVHLNRAVIYSDHLRQDDLAERELKAALQLDPGYLPALLNLGNLHEEHGDRSAALACYDQMLSGIGGDPGLYQDLRFEALARSAQLRPPTSMADPLLEQLLQASTRCAGQGHIVRANLLFALGLAYDRLQEFELAFDAYAKANRCLLRLRGRTYDRKHSAQLTDALIETFAVARPVAGAAATTTSASPVFICGMFRSGSTLIEQVLAAHPRVTPGGELDFLLRLAANRLAPFPQSMAKLDGVRDAAFAEEYRQHLAQLFPAAGADSIITDKRPDNFLLVGLIKRLFPLAKIIHTTRDPIDNGLSIFMQHLNHKVAGYSSDLGDIGHYYGQYRRLMAHWKALYPESILDFEYDSFVREPRSALQRLFGFLELEWDDRCLEFHRLRNAVKTGSYWQVRQPLHGKSSGRWRHYAEHLEPLRLALRSASVDIDQS